MAQILAKIRVCEGIESEIPREERGFLGWEPSVAFPNQVHTMIESPRIPQWSNLKILGTEVRRILRL